MTEEIQDGSKVSGVPVYEVCTSLILATEIDHEVKKWMVNVSPTL